MTQPPLDPKNVDSKIKLLERWVGFFLTPFIPKDWREPLIGDLIEEYTNHIVRTRGPIRSRLWLAYQVFYSAVAGQWSQIRNGGISSFLLMCVTVGIGWFAAYVDSRPHFDDTGVLAFGIMIACFILSAVDTRRPWLTAILIGIWIPVHNILVNHTFVSLLALAFSLSGAYLGAMVGRTMRKHKRPSSSIAS